jgi:hypothetical protein
MDALVEIATSGKSDSARVAASVAIRSRFWQASPEPLQAQNESNVQYFITDKPLTMEEWGKKFFIGN